MAKLGQADVFPMNPTPGRPVDYSPPGYPNVQGYYGPPAMVPNRVENAPQARGWGGYAAGIGPQAQATPQAFSPPLPTWGRFLPSAGVQYVYDLTECPDAVNYGAPHLGIYSGVGCCDDE